MILKNWNPVSTKQLPASDSHPTTSVFEGLTIG